MVVTVTVMVSGPAPLGVTSEGLTVQAASEGAPVHAKLIVWVRPPSPSRLSEYVAVRPGVTVALEEDPDASARLKSCPVPAKPTVCGLPGASSIMVSVPSRAPPAVGLNVTLIEQLAPAATLLPQVFDCIKSLLAEMLVMANGSLPVLVSWTGCEALDVPTICAENVKLEGVRLTPEGSPQPARRTVCGTTEALVVKVSVPPRLPSAVGSKVTLTWQLPPTFSLEGQSFLAVKSPLATTSRLRAAWNPDW